MGYLNTITQYPYLVDKDPFTYAELGETWLDSVPKGWQQVFFSTLDEINEILGKSRVPLAALLFHQVKEKFGRLVIYWGLNTDEFKVPDGIYERIDTLITALENTTGMLCHACGKQAEFLSTGWVLPYCRECAEQWTKESNERHGSNYAVENDFTTIRKERTNVTR